MEKRDPDELVVYANDPSGRPRIYKAKLPKDLIERHSFEAIWDAGATKPMLHVNGEPRPDIPLRDRFATGEGR